MLFVQASEELMRPEWNIVCSVESDLKLFGIGTSEERVTTSSLSARHSYYSTLANDEREDLSADDDNVHSWLDALNEKELSRLRKNFLRNVAASFKSFLRFGYEVSFEALDKGAIEILGPYGISYTFRRLAERISQLQSGFVVRRVRYDPWPPAWWGRLLRCG
ncbi:NADH-ubiquinone oxidoreductase chain 5 [Sesamum angolense]|uniref:NADH-ubiquinone oxidoreductase chain 5 n=1 Tax=Sesamum angolense TaxID=2727404 RepID=A0AAE1VTV7_9LAMI|nr:NADH-ubiquinone oxidoreductase chain 5 [Sesamum angolense]